jgi:hypothetical protein
LPFCDRFRVVDDVLLRLKTAYRDGTTHVILDPLDFLARLAALVPPPRVHVTRYHGVFAPHHALRAAITPAGRGRGARHSDAAERAVPKHLAMSWMQRLKRVFAIEIETCRRCGGKLKVIASIEDPALIERILAHLEQRTESEQPATCRSLHVHRRHTRRSSDSTAALLARAIVRTERAGGAAFSDRARSNFWPSQRRMAASPPGARFTNPLPRSIYGSPQTVR